MSGNALFVLGMASIAAVSIVNLNSMTKMGGCIDCASGNDYLQAKQLSTATAVITGALATLAGLFTVQYMGISSSLDKTVLFVLIGAALLSWWSLGVVDQNCSCMGREDVKSMKALNSVVGSISTIYVLVPLLAFMFPALKNNNSAISGVFKMFPNLFQ